MNKWPRLLIDGFAATLLVAFCWRYCAQPQCRVVVNIGDGVPPGRWEIALENAWGDRVEWERRIGPGDCATVAVELYRVIKWHVRFGDSPVMQYGMGPWFGEVGPSAWHSALSIAVSENPVALTVKCSVNWRFTVVMTMGWMTAVVQIIRLMQWSRAGKCTPVGFTK